MRIDIQEEGPGQSVSHDRKFLPSLLLFVAASYRVTRLGLGRATRFIARQLLLFVFTASLAAGQSTGAPFPNAVLSSADSPREISGLLAKPEGAGPFPAVVLLHTCGGVKPHVSSDWPVYLTGLGYVTLTVDTFGSRGLGPCGNTLHPAGPGPKTEAYREITRDAYGAFDYLAKQPYVAKDRIAVIGFSLGANAINSYLIHEALYDTRPPAANFKAAVGVYGRCYDLLGYTPRTPLMQIVGELDERHVDACRKVHPPIEVHILAGAYHSWDDPQASGKTDAYGTYMRYDRKSTEQSRQLVRDFLARHLGR